VEAPPQDTTVTANAEVATESTKERASNSLLNFFIFPPFKRFYKAPVQQLSTLKSTGHFFNNL
jgi:hypothetical protein